MSEKKTTKKRGEYKIALAGNPNVGKSTVFNYLTGMRQHTGNWAGKTVQNAKGFYTYNGIKYQLMDLPGTHSLYSKSYEEACAEEYITFGMCDAVVVIADANCLERNLNLVFQVTEITPNVILAVNLMDEAEKNGIKIDIERLKKQLGLAVVPMSAGRKKGFEELKEQIENMCMQPVKKQNDDFGKTQGCMGEINRRRHILVQEIERVRGSDYRNGYFAMRLLYDEKYSEKLFKNLDFENSDEIMEIVKALRQELYSLSVTDEVISDCLTSELSLKAEETARDCVTQQTSRYKSCLNALDRIFTGRLTGTVTMVGLLLLVLWITIYGANYPSQWLSGILLGFEDKLATLFLKAGVSPWVVNMVVHGGYNVLAWVVSVMLPPMAIFFPLFTILEDFGYLPRVAYNLDFYFSKANTCGKQALTMCMGFGCNAVGVMGCRIIDSPRERIIATITNSFVPCNGRFPTLIAIISMFFLVSKSGVLGSLLSSLFLCGVLVLGVVSTFAVSKFLSKTLLKGVPSSFTLEMPPYRKPQFCKVLVRSVFDRTLFVLGRAVAVAAPAGLFIWVLANIYMGDKTILAHITEFLDPLGRLMGMDGVILTAFILGFPANEVVIPIMLMTYMQKSVLCDFSSLEELRQLLVSNGWTVVTAVCVMIFCLMHWPCSTTLLTVKKETKSLKWTAYAFLIPTLCGAFLCIAVNMLSKIFIF